jgi:hypothetical protein
MRNIIPSLRKNSNQCLANGAQIGEVLLYAEPIRFKAAELADFIRNGPVFTATGGQPPIIQNGAFAKMLFRCADGIVEVTSTAMLMRSLP